VSRENGGMEYRTAKVSDLFKKGARNDCSSRCGWEVRAGAPRLREVLEGEEGESNLF